MPPKPTTLRNRLRQATSQEILSAAETVLAREGFEATGMISIAREAGVAVGTLYNYFNDKNELRRALFEARAGFLYEQLDAVRAELANESFEVQLDRILHTIFKINGSNRNFLKIFFEHEEPSGKLARGLVDWFQPVIKDGVASGCLDASGAWIYPVALAAVIRGVVLELLADDQASFTDATKHVVTLFMQGARARPKPN